METIDIEVGPEGKVLVGQLKELLERLGARDIRVIPKPVTRLVFKFPAPVTPPSVLDL